MPPAADLVHMLKMSESEVKSDQEANEANVAQNEQSTNNGEKQIDAEAITNAKEEEKDKEQAVSEPNKLEKSIIRQIEVSYASSMYTNVYSNLVYVILFNGWKYIVIYGFVVLFW